MNKILTIIIPSYKSSPLVKKHLKKFYNKYKIIIIENSYDKNLKNFINKKYSKTKIFLQKNLGFGGAVNCGAKYVKTKFFLVLNPDTKINNLSIINLLKAAVKIKKFGGICPDHISTKHKTIKKKIIEKNSLYGAAMLFNTKIFKKIKGFDDKIFLYYEENDYFKKCQMKKLKLYIIKNSFFNHSLKGDSTSAVNQNNEEKFYSYLLGGWHGQWSKFYYYKKYNGYLFSLKKCLPNLLIYIIKFLINCIVNPKKSIYYYFNIEGLIYSMLGRKSFKRSKFDLF